MDVTRESVSCHSTDPILPCCAVSQSKTAILPTDCPAPRWRQKTSPLPSTTPWKRAAAGSTGLMTVHASPTRSVKPRHPSPYLPASSSQTTPLAAVVRTASPGPSSAPPSRRRCLFTTASTPAAPWAFGGWTTATAPRVASGTTPTAGLSISKARSAVSLRVRSRKCMSCDSAHSHATSFCGAMLQSRTAIPPTERLAQSWSKNSCIFTFTTPSQRAAAGSIGLTPMNVRPSRTAMPQDRSPCHRTSSMRTTRAVAASETVSPDPLGVP